jgi:Protein of unknown function (DUF3592)
MTELLYSTSPFMVFGCIIVSALCLANALYKSWNVVTPIAWRKASGVITRSVVTSREIAAEENAALVAMYVFDVVYEYRVGSRTFQSSSLLYGADGWSSLYIDEVRDIADEYPHGSEVTVFYHPQRPQHATLTMGEPERGVNWYVGMSMLSVLVGTIVWWLAR